MSVMRSPEPSRFRSSSRVRGDARLERDSLGDLGFLEELARAQRGLGKAHGIGGQLGEAHALQTRERMGGACDHAKRMPDGGQNADPRIVGGLKGKAQMGLVLHDQAGHLAGRGRHAHVQAQSAMAGNEPGQHSGQRRADEALADGEAHPPRSQSLQVGQAALETLAVRALLGVVLDQQAARFGQHHRAAAVLYQGYPYLGFELRDLPADG